MRKRAPVKSVPKANRTISSAQVVAPHRRVSRSIRGRLRSASREVIESCRELLAAKSHSKRTVFQSWVNEEVGLSKREAASYLRVGEMVATKFGDRYAALEGFSIPALQKLAEPKVPDSVRTEVRRRLEADEPLRSEDILKMCSDAVRAERLRKRAEREEERLAQLSPEQRAEQNADRAGIDAVRSGQGQLSQDEVERAAADVMDRIGVDVLASLAEQLGEAAGPAFRLAVGLAVSQHHRQDELIELPVNEIELPVREVELPVSEIACTTNQNLDEGHISGDDTVLDIAARIEAGDPVPPISVAENYGGGYDLTEGHLTYKAYTDVLERSTVPVHVVPPLEIRLGADEGRGA